MQRESIKCATVIEQIMRLKLLQNPWQIISASMGFLVRQVSPVTRLATIFQIDAAEPISAPTKFLGAHHVGAWILTLDHAGISQHFVADFFHARAIRMNVAMRFMPNA